MPFSITGIGASAAISSNTTKLSAASGRSAPSASASGAISPSFATIGSVTTMIRRWPKPAIAWPSRALAPGPTSSVGCGIGSTRVTRPAARFAAGSPIVRAKSPSLFGIKGTLREL
ncbi:MAG: hypothetical protein AMXMBFR72_15920 [Betaproteobacteria bacterium]